MDPIAAIGSANSSSFNTERAMQCRDQHGTDNLQACGGELPGAHLNHVAPVVEPPPPMNVVSAAHMFSDRMKNGFYMKQLEDLMVMVGDDSVGPGEKQAALMEVQGRVGVSSVVSKIAQHLAEGIQTVVTKSG
jgi:hypothetical protein